MREFYYHIKPVVSECVMNDMDRPYGDLEEHANVENHSECQEKCKLLNDCNVWTFVSGICYMKNENTFKGSGDNVISGTKECNNSGIMVLRA